MARTKPAKRDLGPHYSEGARLTWVELHRRGWTQTRFQLELKAASGMVSRWLYGEKRPSALWIARIEQVFGGRVPGATWGQEPKRATGTEG